jgi:hypothetical protein
MEDFNTFVDYVLSFYGADGLYNMGATREQVEICAKAQMLRASDFCGDSVDREATRDLLISIFDLKFPSSL